MIKKAIDKIEEVLAKNIANDLIEIEFHAYATEDEIREYYGGGINRQEYLGRAVAQLKKDVLFSRFINKRKKYIIKKYGDKNADQRFVDAVQRDIRDTSEKRGRIGNTQETTQGPSTQGRTNGPDNRDSSDKGTTSRRASAGGRTRGADSKDAPGSDNGSNQA